MLRRAGSVWGERGCSWSRVAGLYEWLLRPLQAHLSVLSICDGSFPEDLLADAHAVEPNCPKKTEMGHLICIELAQAVDLKELEKEVAGIPAAKHGVEVKNFESRVYINKNGKIEEITEKENKVSNPALDQVVAELKQTLVKTQEGPQSKPVTHVETDVDIPSEGIHDHSASEEKKSSVVDVAESQSQITCDDLFNFLSVNGRRLNVEDVARFVVESEDTVGFERLVFTMVALKCMSQNQADRFREEVYEKIDGWKQEAEEEELESEYEQLMDELLNEESEQADEDDEEDPEEQAADEDVSTLNGVIQSIVDDLTEETEEGDNSAENTIKELSESLKKEREDGNISPETERQIFETVAARVVPVVLARDQPKQATSGRKYLAQAEGMRGY